MRNFVFMLFDVSKVYEGFNKRDSRRQNKILTGNENSFKSQNLPLYFRIKTVKHRIFDRLLNLKND